MWLKITTFLAIILTLKNFVFKRINENKCIYLFLHGTTLAYLQFIGDIFFIWTGTKEQSTYRLNNLNT